MSAYETRRIGAERSRCYGSGTSFLSRLPIRRCQRKLHGVKSAIRDRSPLPRRQVRKRKERGMLSSPWEGVAGSRAVTPVLCWLFSMVHGAHSQSPPPPGLEYVKRMRQAQEDPQACPLLMLAPMESLGDWHFRRAIAETVGGFDEACTEFLRIPNHTDHPWASVKGVISNYNARELGEVPIGAQIMSSNPELLGLATNMLFRRRQAPRVDLNCGCPANTVTGKGAGSSLLRTPEVLHACVKAMVEGAEGAGPVSVKMRSGFEDTSLFEENLLAAQEGGAAFITVHPRTKRQTYDGRADWSLVARARQLLHIPVVGNGDVVSVAAARQLLSETGCGAVMIGRGAVSDPLLFLRLRASFKQEAGAQQLPWVWDEPEIVQAFLRSYAATCLKPPPPPAVDAAGISGDRAETAGHWAAEEAVVGTLGAGSGLEGMDGRLAMSRSVFFGRMKKIMRYLFSSEPALCEASEGILRAQPGAVSAEELVEILCKQVQRHWSPEGGPTQRMLYNHMTKTTQVMTSGGGEGGPTTAAGSGDGLALVAGASVRWPATVLL